MRVCCCVVPSVAPVCGQHRVPVWARLFTYHALGPGRCASGGELCREGFNLFEISDAGLQVLQPPQHAAPEPGHLGSLDVAAADHLVEQLENECGGSVSFVLEQRTNPLPLLIDGREPGGGGRGPDLRRKRGAK